jgi:hypothetical protein
VEGAVAAAASVLGALVGRAPSVALRESHLFVTTHHGLQPPAEEYSS